MLGTAANSNFARHPQSKTANFQKYGAHGPLTWRPGADRYVFLVTDEDSDCPFFDANRFYTNGKLQCTGPGNVVSDNDRTMEAANNFNGNSDFPGGETNAWAHEVSDLVKAIVSTKAHISAFVKPQVGITVGQWGDPRLQSQNADFSNYNAAATAQAQRNAGWSNSLMVRAFTADSTADVRIFDTNDITSKSGSIDNFFVEIAKKIVNPCFGRKRAVSVAYDANASARDLLPPDVVSEFDAATAATARKRQGAPVCVINSCDLVGTHLCVAAPKCADLVACDNCLINGVCYQDSTPNPTNKCQVCNWARNKNAWTDACDDRDDCTMDTCENNQCKHSDVCTAQCGKCLIKGQCVGAGTPNPQDPCEMVPQIRTI